MVIKTRRVGHAYTLPTAPAYSFGGRQNSTLDRAGPGPGEYDLAVDWRNGRGSTFGGSTRQERLQDAQPSAQEYHTDASMKHTLRSAAGYSLAGTPRPDFKNDNPGPGSYEADVAAARVKRGIPALSMSPRLDVAGPTDGGPGPAMYSPLSPDARKGVSLKFRHPEPGSGEAGPGPGEYGSPRPWRQGSTGKTMGARRPASSGETGIPGPGQYTADDKNVCSRRTAAWSFGEKLGRSGRSDVPGPGTYMSEGFARGPGGKSENRNSPTWSMPGRRATTPGAISPAGTDYRPRDSMRRSSPAFSFRGVAAKDAKGWVPGPGTYENPADGPTYLSSPRVTVSATARLVDDAAAGGPGPQAYTLPQPSPTKPGVSIKFRHSINVSDGGPSPAEYNVTSPGPSPGKGITFGQRLASSQRDATPGPIYLVGCSTLGIAASNKLEETVMDRTVVL